LESIDAIIAIQKLTRQLDTDSELAKGLLGRLWRGIETNFGLVDSVLQWMQEGKKSDYVNAHGRIVAARLEDHQQLAQP
jgi:hypothetical protein